MGHGGGSDGIEEERGGGVVICIYVFEVKRKRKTRVSKVKMKKTEL